MRNFGGTNDINKIVKRFLEKVTANHFCFEQSPSDMEVSSYYSLLFLNVRCIFQKYDCTSKGLIKASLQSRDTSWHG